MRESLKIVIVGHVDHGKSTLIGRLFFDTGSLPPEKMREIERISEDLGHETEFAFLMDHLQEERDQGITIDTAQTFFKSPSRDYVIIDAPGHRQFLKNMITGATQAEAAVLVVDVTEGVKEQTTRHSYLLSLLGVRQLVVAVNKMDAVGFAPEPFHEVAAPLTQFLEEISARTIYLVPISARHGDNVASRSSRMPWYQGPTLLEALDKFSPLTPSSGPLRFPVQDVYHRDGKAIVVGRPESGTLRVGDPVLILPEGRPGRVVTLEKFMASPQVLETGESAGFTLDVPPPRRGDVVVGAQDPPVPTTAVPATVFWLSRTPARLGETLIFRCTTQETPCTITRIRRRVDSSSLQTLEVDASSLAETEVAELELRTQAPVVVEDHAAIPELGRFVLERDTQVVAGGIVTLKP